MANQPLYFYNKDEPYYEFTNFAPYEVKIGQTVWPTSEHYFQAMKFRNSSTDLMEQIRQNPNPRDAFETSRKFQRYVDPKWSEVKDGFMMQVVTEKFKQHPELQEMLLRTGDRELVEHTALDKYWGDGGDGQGKNKLGRLLVIVRDQLRKERKERGISDSTKVDIKESEPPHQDYPDDEQAHLLSKVPDGDRVRVPIYDREERMPSDSLSSPSTSCLDGCMRKFSAIFAFIWFYVCCCCCCRLVTKEGVMNSCYSLWRFICCCSLWESIGRWCCGSRDGGSGDRRDQERRKY